MNPDEQLDQLLSQQPRQVSPGFQDRVMAEIQSAEQDPPLPEEGEVPTSAPSRKIVPFPALMGGLGLAAAAALVIGLLLQGPASNPGLGDGPQLSQNGEGEASPGETWTDPSALTEDELLALEESLEDLEFLFEEDNLEMLSLLSDSFNT